MQNQGLEYGHTPPEMQLKFDRLDGRQTCTLSGPFQWSDRLGSAELSAEAREAGKREGAIQCIVQNEYRNEKAMVRTDEANQIIHITSQPPPHPTLV